MLVLMLSFNITVKAEYVIEKSHSIIKRGEVIYFDTTGLDWQHVYIHLWEQDGAEYKDWSSDDEMTKVEGTENIYMFTIPDEIDEKYNMVVFHNIYGGDENQTINLSYVEEKFAYIVTGYSDGKRIGHWYLYDKSTLQNHLNDLKQYQIDKDYYTTSSYSNLDELIDSIELALDGEIRLEKNVSDPSKYYIVVDYTFSEADDIVETLEVNTDLLSDLIIEEEANYGDYAEEYTKDSLDGYKELINTQKEVLNKTNITVNDIKNSINSINTAKEELVEQADKKELKKQLKEVSDLDKDKYTEESFKELEDLLEGANKILNDTNIEQDEIDEMVKKLKDVKDKLVEKEEINEGENIEVPKTLDSITKTFSILGISILTLFIIISIIKKNKLLIKR